MSATAPNPPFALPLISATGWTTPDGAGVTVVGELDLAGAPLLAAEVNSVCCAAADGDVREFLLDLEGVTFLDSAGLRAADRAEVAAAARGWRVRVLVPAGSEPRCLITLATCHGRKHR